MTQFSDEEIPRILSLELVGIRMNENEKVKHFNERLISLLNRIPIKPAKEVHIEYYTFALSPNIAIFVKNQEILTLVENFEEAIKVEKYLAYISSHLGNEENKASTSERNGKKSKGISKLELDEKDKDPTYMESMQ